MRKILEVRAPVFPDSVESAEIASFHVKLGEHVCQDTLLFDIETDKVVLEVVSSAEGAIVEFKKQLGETVKSNEVIAISEEDFGDDNPDEIVTQLESLKSEESLEPQKREDPIVDQTVNQTTLAFPIVTAFVLGLVVASVIFMVVGN